MLHCAACRMGVTGAVVCEGGGGHSPEAEIVSVLVVPKQSARSTRRRREGAAGMATSCPHLGESNEMCRPKSHPDPSISFQGVLIFSGLFLRVSVLDLSLRVRSEFTSAHKSINRHTSNDSSIVNRMTRTRWTWSFETDIKPNRQLKKLTK